MRDVDGFEEDGDALDGFVADGALFGGELEGVGDFVGEILGGQGLRSGGFRLLLLLLVLLFPGFRAFQIDFLKAVMNVS